MSRRNTEKYITFFVRIKKENDNGKTVTYKLKFIDSLRCMLSSLLALPDILTGGLHKDECKNYKSCLEYVTVNDSLLVFKCVNDPALSSDNPLRFRINLV